MNKQIEGPNLYAAKLYCRRKPRVRDWLARLGVAGAPSGASVILFPAVALLLLAMSARPVHAQSEKNSKPSRGQLVNTFLDTKASKQERLVAIRQVGYAGRDAFSKLLAVGTDASVDDELRLEALKRHPWGNTWAEAIISILNDPNDGGADFNSELVQLLSQRTVRVPNAELRQKIQRAYRQLLDDERKMVRARAYFALVSTQDPVAVTKLVDGLADDGKNCPVALNHAIEMIDVAGATRHFNALRPYLDHQDEQVRGEAVRVLAADSESRPKIADLISDAETPEYVRVQGLRGMSHYDNKLASYAIPLIHNTDSSVEVRQAAINAMFGQVNYKQLDDSVQLEFVEAVKAFAADPKVTSQDKKTSAQVEALMRNLQQKATGIEERIRNK